MSRSALFFILLIFTALGLVLSGLVGCSGGEDNWSLRLEGVRTETLGQRYFEKGVAEKCHGMQYTDEQGRVWEGMPLWLLAGRVDNTKRHKNGYDDALADKGYEIEVSSADRSVRLDSREVTRNNSILVANLMNGSPLPGEMSPLALVGKGIDDSRRLDKITSIKLIISP